MRLHNWLWNWMDCLPVRVERRRNSPRKGAVAARVGTWRTELLEARLVLTNDFDPVITSASSANVAENSSGVLTVTATDADDPAQVFSFVIVGGADQGKFQINGASGALSFNSAPDFENPTDGGGDNIYVVEVQASDGSRNSATQSISVTVTALNDNSPIITSVNSASVPENSTAVLTVTATDADHPGDTVSFAIVGGGDQAKFLINSASGVLTFQSAPNFESPTDANGDNVYVVQVQASDGSLTSSTQTISVTVTGINDNDPAITSANSTNVAENTTAVLTVTASDADLPAQTLSFAIVGGTDQMKFQINSSTGALAFNTAPDFEAPADANLDNVYVVQVQASDGVRSSTVQTISVTVTGVNDIDPTITSASSASVAENSTAVLTVTASDADLPSQTLSFAIVGGADQLKFQINSGTGALTFKAGPDFDIPGDFNGDNIYVVQVQASDGSRSSTTQTINVTVTGMNDNDPAMTSSNTVNVAENSTAVLTLTASDADQPAQTLTFSLVGGIDSGKFQLNSSTGALTFASAPDRENPTDANGDNVYIVQVQASDGTRTSSTQTINVTVTGVNDNDPTITSSNSASVAENSTTVLTVTATDADLPAQTLTFAIVGGTDQLKFQIDAATGALTFKFAPDFDVPADVNGDNVYLVLVQAGDGTRSSTTQSISVTVTGVNDNDPVINSSNSVNVVENTTDVLTVTATDADQPGPTLTYAIVGGADLAKFLINSTTGGVTFQAAPNFEAPTDANMDNVYVVQVQASDGTRTSTTQTINVTVTGTNDNSPVFTSSSTVNVAENTTTVLTTTATDADSPAQTITFSLVGGTDQAKFQINSSSGALTFVTAPDFESPTDANSDNVYGVQVQASDGAGGTSTQTINVTVTGVNDNNPVITSASTASVAENSATVLTVTASDADVPAGTLTFAIVGGADQAKFQIVAATGALTFATAPNFEVPTDANGDNVYLVQVQASDGTRSSTTQSISVTVTGINDNDPVVTSASTKNVVENSTAVLTVTATDADVPTQTTTFAIVGGADQAKFQIDSASGVLSFKAAPDFDAPGDANADNVYVVQVQASDGTRTSTAQSINVTVTGLNDNDPVITSDNTKSVAEGTTSVLTVIATDADLPASTLTYSVVAGSDQTLFQINSATGALSFKTAPDFEHPTDANGDNVYVVQVQASDGSRSSNTQTVSVTVTNVITPNVTISLPIGGGQFRLDRNGDLLQVYRSNGTTVGSALNIAEVLGINITGSAKADTVEFGASMASFLGGIVFTAGEGNDKLDATDMHFDVSMLGEAGNDILIGGNGNDTFLGGIGNDNATGGLGNDTLSGDAGNDILAGGGGADLLSGDDGNDKVDGGDGNGDTVSGGAGNDSLSGGAGFQDLLRETINGRATLNAKSLKGSLGSDSQSGFEQASLTGGSGNDTLDAGDATSALLVTLIGGSGNDLLIGGAAGDLLQGGDGNDVIEGGAGSDTLDGQDGNDTLTGGLDNDNLTGGAGTDCVAESADLNFTLINASLTTAGATGSVDSLSSIESAQLTGGAGNNTLDASGFSLGSVTLSGDRGADTLIGSPADDLLDGGVGNDSLQGGEGADSLLGGAGFDNLNGGGGNDRLNGQADADVLNGSSGDDSLTGEAGNDSFDGGSGTDQLIETANVNFTLTDTQLTGAGTDTLVLSSIEIVVLTGGAGANKLDASAFSTGSVRLSGLGGKDTLLGGAGNDSLDGSLGNDSLVGAAGNDTLLGGANDDILDGGSGHDVLDGQDGNDSLIGGDNRDLLIGGLGSDSILGGTGDDILISGTTSLNAAGIVAVMAEWTSLSTYTDRVTHLTNGSGGANGSTKLDATTVQSDVSNDSLTGGADTDWFFGSATEVQDLLSGETRTTV